MKKETKKNGKGLSVDEHNKLFLLTVRELKRQEILKIKACVTLLRELSEVSDFFCEDWLGTLRDMQEVVNERALDYEKPDQVLYDKVRDKEYAVTLKIALDTINKILRGHALRFQIDAIYELVRGLPQREEREMKEEQRDKAIDELLNNINGLSTEDLVKLSDELSKRTNIKIAV